MHRRLELTVLQGKKIEKEKGKITYITIILSFRKNVYFQQFFSSIWAVWFSFNLI